MNVHVYHDREPSFGADTPPWPARYRRVAMMRRPSDSAPEDALEQAFLWTQNGQEPWPGQDSRDFLVLKDASGRTGSAARHRSTSVGDVVVVGGVAYRCEATGWTRLPRPPFDYRGARRRAIEDGDWDAYDAIQAARECYDDREPEDA